MSKESRRAGRSGDGGASLPNAIASTIAEIQRSGLGEHNALVYPDLATFRKIYSECEAGA